MASNIYNSVFTGSQIDSALSVIHDSNITTAQLSVLIGVSPGVATASKAVVLNGDKDISGLNNVSSKRFTSDVSVLKNLSADPTDNPPSGYIFLYFKNGALFTKNDAGEVSEFKSGETKEFDFTNATLVPVNHEFGYRYPQTFIVIGNAEEEGRVDFTDVDNLTVRFNSPQTGKVIVSKV